MQKRWLVSDPIPEEEIKTLSNALKVNTAVAEILLQRKITSFAEAESFFRPKIEMLHDPFLMKGMGLAVSRLEQALENQEKVMLYGDYDVDGTSSVAMLYTYFKNRLDNLTFYIPDRYEEGYGVSEKGMNEALKKEVDLIITLDCGIKNTKELNKVTSQGSDIIL